MILSMTTGGLAGTNSFLIGDEATRQAVVFDAPDHTVGPLLDLAAERNLEVIGLWLTHGHFDHIADHAEVTRRYHAARVLIHQLDEPKLQAPNSSMFVLSFIIPPRNADANVEDGQQLAIGGLSIEVIHTPGHAPGHVMYHLPEEKILVGGDLIIGGAVGRTDLPDSDESALFRSIRRVMRLPADTRLLPGHGAVSTLDDERRSNPFVRHALEADA